MKITLHPPATIKNLETYPENSHVELINGVFRVLPQPSGVHIKIHSELLGELYGPYSRGIGGKGGWLFAIKPQLYFTTKNQKEQSTIPAIAGWKRERLPEFPKSHRFDVVPDWVCEIISEGSRTTDRKVKPKLYLEAGVSFLWLIDPSTQELEVRSLLDGYWQIFDVFYDADNVRAVPFVDFELDLSLLWIA